LSSAAIFDLLASSRQRRAVGDPTAPPALSAEFVSRLAKGGAAVFNRLETRHYLQLIERSVKSPPSQAAQPLPPAVTIEKNAKLLFLLACLPDLDARRVVSRSAGWAAEIVMRSFEDCRDSIPRDAPARFGIRLICDREAETLLRRQFDSTATRLLLIDDD